MQIPFWERYTLTIQEASQYFRIGETKLRKIVSENKDADFVLWNGTAHRLNVQNSSDLLTNSTLYDI